MGNSFLRGFSESDFAQQNGGSGDGKKYIKAGVYPVTLAISYGRSKAKDTPYLEVVYTAEDGAISDTQHYITPNSFSVVLGNVAKLALAAGVKDQLKTATDKTFTGEEDWVKTVASVLNGTQVAAAFRSREYINKESEVKTIAEFWIANATSETEALQNYWTANPDKQVVKLPVQSTTSDFGAPMDNTLPLNNQPPAFDPFATNGAAASANLDAVFNNH